MWDAVNSWVIPGARRTLHINWISLSQRREAAGLYWMHIQWKPYQYESYSMGHWFIVNNSNEKAAFYFLWIMMGKRITYLLNKQTLNTKCEFYRTFWPFFLMTKWQKHIIKVTFPLHLQNVHEEKIKCKLISNESLAIRTCDGSNNEFVCVKFAYKYFHEQLKIDQ